MTGPAVLATVAAACAAASAILVRVVRDFANRRSLLDRPNDRSSHSVPKPRLGGVGVMAPVLAVGCGLVLAGRAPPALLVPLGATSLVALLGLVDDLHPLPARVRFGFQVALASAVVGVSWDRLPAASGELGAWLPTPVLAVLAVTWIVWLTNLYNFMDGIDGLAGAQALVASIGLAAVAVSVGASTTGWMLVALAGASVGFLLFNFPPSSIFMGDVGSTAIGFLFGVIPLLPEARAVPVEPVALALSLFVLDATATLVRRMRSGEKWYTPHRTHLYQRPLARGLSHRTVLLVAGAGMVIVAGCAAVWVRSSGAGRVALVSVPVALFGSGIVAVRRIERRTGSVARSR